MKLVRALSTIVAFCVLAPAAQGAVISQVSGPVSGTNGIALGPDGNLWVADQYADSVTRMTPSGTVISQYSVGSNPQTVTTGPGGRVWVAVTGANKLTWFDATSTIPVPHDVSTSAVSSCGPAGLVAGPDLRIYFSSPTDGACNAGINVLGSVSSTGTDLHGQSTAGGDSVGQAFSLAVSQGKLMVPDFDSGVVRRMSLGTTVVRETVVNMTDPNAGPDAITADTAGNVWFTGLNSNHIYRFPVTQNGGSAVTFTPTGGTLTGLGGIVVSSSSVYVTGTSSANIARLTPSTGAWDFYATGGKPFSIIEGPDADLFATDQLLNSLVHVINRAPRPSAAALTASSPTTLTAGTTVDLGGNQTTVTFEYGTTTAYGSSSAPTVLPTTGASVLPAAATLTGLQPGTAYHVRVRATNSEGSAVGPDTVLQTSALPSVAPPAAPTITAAKLSKSSFAIAKGKKGGSTLTVSLSAAGSVTATVTQKAKGVKKKTTCVAPPRKKKRGQKSCTRVVTKGTLSLGRLNAGANSVAITGKIGKKSLPAGKYTLTLTVGTSTTSVPFTIKK